MSAKFFTSILVPLFILIPILTAISKIRFLDKAGRVVLLYLTVVGLLDTAATITGRVFHKNNLWFSHLLAPIEIVFIVLFYFYLHNSQKNKKIYLYVVSGFVTMCLLNVLYIQKFYTYSSYTRSLEALITIMFSLSFYAKLAAEDIVVNKLSGFYFNTGFFLYFSGAFMLFLFSNFSIFGVSLSNYYTLWITHACLLLIMYIFFTIAFLLCKK